MLGNFPEPHLRLTRSLLKRGKALENQSRNRLRSMASASVGGRIDAAAAHCAETQLAIQAFCTGS